MLVSCIVLTEIAWMFPTLFGLMSLYRGQLYTFVRCEPCSVIAAICMGNGHIIATSRCPLSSAAQRQSWVRNKAVARGIWPVHLAVLPELDTCFI